MTATALFVLAVSLLSALGMVISAGDSQAASASAGNDKATRQLFQAVYANDLASARTSVGEGADVNAQDRWGMTPTDIAIDRGNYQIAHFLVSVRNIRRDQQARGNSAAPLPAVAASPSVAANNRQSSTPVAASTAAKSAPSNTTPPAVKGDAPFMGPNPFDPTTPAPGSQLQTPAGISRTN
ncbi:MAG: ankyrin repeat domain-containing protein [Rhodospirillales bacterium]|nr:ankyrin repeat domain-containing protein [Rhodospirillales bacterium]